MRQDVRPIKDSNVLAEVQDTLLNFTGKLGPRNYTIFVTGKCTLLRVSDVLKLQYTDIYDEQGNVNRNAYEHDQKTGKPNLLYLKPVYDDLVTYHEWLVKTYPGNKWMFPNDNDPKEHINPKGYYKVMRNVGELLGIKYLGTHTMRKTGALRVYEQTNHDIALVMKLLKQGSEAITLDYLGLDQESVENKLDQIDFG